MYIDCIDVTKMCMLVEPVLCKYAYLKWQFGIQVHMYNVHYAWRPIFVFGNAEDNKRRMRPASLFVELIKFVPDGLALRMREEAKLWIYYKCKVLFEDLKKKNAGLHNT